MIAKKLFCAALGAVILIAAFITFWIARSTDFKFRERAFPAGFRELAFENESSPLNPILGPLNAPIRENRLKLSTRDVCDAVFRDSLSPAFGNANGKVQIAAFLDYRCPYCKTLTKILSEITVSHSVRVVYKEWPILGNGSVLAARAALAAGRQGKYLAFHTRLMNSRFIPTSAYIESLAVELGMNLERLREDMNGSDVTLSIQSTAAIASDLGFSGTPVLVVGRTIVHGAITRVQLERLIENEAIQSLIVC